MRPGLIPELDVDKTPLPTTGVMYVGDKGKILNGKLIPEAKMTAYKGPKPPAPTPQAQAPATAPGAAPAPRPFTIGNLPPKFDQWIAAVRGGTKDTPGNFVSAQHLSTMINLAIVSLRAGTRVDFDRVTRKITNNPDLNKLLVREYRKGWEL
jgi:hypothetical protein